MDKGGVINFRAPSITISETGKVATIVVTRTNGTASGVSVNFTANTGNATQGRDYTPTNGTLNFAAGVASQ